MKKIVLKHAVILIVGCLILFTAILTGVNVTTVKASAASTTETKFTGVTGSPDGADLYDATNTYKYNGDNELRDRDYQYYDTSERIENQQSAQQIIDQKGVNATICYDNMVEIVEQKNKTAPNA